MRSFKLPRARQPILQICARCRTQALRASIIPRATPASRAFAASAPLASNGSRRALFSTSSAVASSPDSSSSPPASEATSTSSSSPPDSQPPPRTHYDLFPSTLSLGPPPCGPFSIDTRALRREFLQLQARAHPDLHPAGSKARAEAASAALNDAHRTLSSPLLRAQYLLQLRGHDVAEDETLKVEEPNLLMQVLEAREDIEDAAAEDDLQPLRAANDQRIAESERVLERAFADDDVDAAKREAVRLRYWINIKDSLDNWEPGKPVVLEH